jgi:hypothetical protein
MINSPRVISLVIGISVATACTSANVTGKFPSAPASSGGATHLFVMPAASAQNSMTGNVGVSFADAQRLIDDKLLATAREKDPAATLADIQGTTPYQPMDPYVAAAAPARVTSGELNAAGYARAHGGTHLLVPTIIQWRQMRSDDPIGGVLQPHNSVVIELRLVRLDPVATEGDVTFTNLARFTGNQSASWLLDDQFTKVVKRLIAD